MKAPTNVYGPGGELVEKGEPIPSEWFDVLPDLRAHLDNVERAPDPEAAAEPPKKAAPKKVTAKATIGRKRSSS